MRPDETNMNASRENVAEAVPAPVSPEDEKLERGPFVDGFSIRTVIGALFVALVMMPGAIYMGLVAGQSLGGAAEWVTIILFTELARRSFVRLARQEVFVLFYVASGIAAVVIPHLALAGGPFAGPIWNQYLLQSPQTSSIADQIPDWVVPPAISEAISGRNLAHIDWWWSKSKGFLSPVILIAIGSILGRLAGFGMGYIVFRLVSDVERLPFPMAPIGAEGSTALAESTTRDTSGQASSKPSWRWTVFSVGASLGVIFGALYVLVPVVSGLFLTKPMMIFPIPFLDLTANVESFLPASLVSISFDAMAFLAGMILPFRLVQGNFTAMMLTGVLGAPLLLKLGCFKHWRPGNGLLVNQMLLGFDFWMSVTIGFAVAVMLIGFVSLGRAFYARARRKRAAAAPEAEDPEAWRRLDPSEPPYRTRCRERGDFPVWLAIAMFIVATTGFAWICKLLVPGFPFWIILLFGFLWTPIHSYISGRLIGISGSGLATPFLKETAFITSGYKGVDIWFAPIPLGDHGGMAQQFRTLELTRTRFTSIFKAEVLMLPITFVTSFLFWWFFWHLNQIPSNSFPYAARIWPVAARQAFLIFTANSSQQSLLLQALDPQIIVGAAAIGLAIYLGLAALRMPVVFFYGLMSGIGAPLHGSLLMILGALFGRFYFRKRFGEERWARYLPVAIAGFSCGMGLASMTAVAFTIVMQCTRELPF